MAHHSLSDPLDISAEWHLPAAPEKRIAGRVQFAPRRIDLSLHDTFTPLRGSISVSDAVVQYPAIHGVSTAGEALTVLGAQRTHTTFGFSSGGMRQPETVVAPCLIVGAHVSADHLYPKVRFFIPGLEIWLSRAQIEHVFGGGSAPGVHMFTVQGAKADTTAIPSIDAKLEWGTATTSSANVFQSVSVEIHGWVTVIPSTPKSLHWFMEQQSKIVTMLSFVAGTPMPIDAIVAKVDGSSHTVSVMAAAQQTPRCAFKNPSDFFILRNQTGLDLESLASNWFSEIETTLIPSQLALSAIASTDLWVHVKFASLIQALEGFHRGRCGGLYTDEKAYEAVKKALSDAIPAIVSADHKEALRSRIRYGNQISLAKRLNELTALLGEPLARIILGDAAKVPRTWIDTRNYHSHWDDELRSNIVEGQDMFIANVRMEHFVRVLFLTLMGIAPDVIAAAYSNTSGTAQQLAQLNITERHHKDPSQPPGVVMTIELGAPKPAATEPAPPIDCAPTESYSEPTVGAESKPDA